MFDALLLRSDVCEEETFFEAARLAASRIEFSGLKTEDIFLARCQAQELARRCGKPKDAQHPSIVDVIAGVLAVLGLPPEAAQALYQIELQYQLTQLRTHPCMESFLARHNRDRSVLLVPNTHLDQWQVAALVTTFFPKIRYRFHFNAEGDEKVGPLPKQTFDGEQLPLLNILHLGCGLVPDAPAAEIQGLLTLHLPIPDAVKKRRAERREAFLSHIAADWGFSLDQVL